MAETRSGLVRHRAETACGHRGGQDAGRIARPADRWSKTAMITPAAAAAWRLFETFATWYRRTLERDRLARLSDRELRDIGLRRGDVAEEIGKPFWRA
jgi:uncharacterized protein YjiS (DUF1127 family)